MSLSHLGKQTWPRQGAGVQWGRGGEEEEEEGRKVSRFLMPLRNNSYTVLSRLIRGRTHQQDQSLHLRLKLVGLKQAPKQTPCILKALKHEFRQFPVFLQHVPRRGSRVDNSPISLFCADQFSIDITWTFSDRRRKPEQTASTRTHRENMQTAHRKIPGLGKNEKLLCSDCSVFARLFQAASAAANRRFVG